MKHFEAYDNCIQLGSVFSICREDGVYKFEEECDQYFSVEKSREEAIGLLEEAIAWINE